MPFLDRFVGLIRQDLFKANALSIAARNFRSIMGDVGTRLILATLPFANLQAPGRVSNVSVGIPV